jgi:hypothetical protein
MNDTDVRCVDDLDMAVRVNGRDIHLQGIPAGERVVQIEDHSYPGAALTMTADDARKVLALLATPAAPPADAQDTDPDRIDAAVYATIAAAIDEQLLGDVIAELSRPHFGLVTADEHPARHLTRVTVDGIEVPLNTVRAFDDRHGWVASYVRDDLGRLSVVRRACHLCGDHLCLETVVQTGVVVAEGIVHATPFHSRAEFYAALAGGRR